MCQKLYPFVPLEITRVDTIPHGQNNKKDTKNVHHRSTKF
jgi:hypothetical protein